MMQAVYALKNTVTGEVVEIDDDALQELAACLKYAREKNRKTVFFRTMRISDEEALKIINDTL